MKTKNVRIFTDGSGQRLDGKGSGFAYQREGSNDRQVKRVDGLTNNQAEYHGIILALESLSPGASVEILSDSENTCCQLNGVRRVLNPHLSRLYDQVQSILKKKRIDARFVWVPRKDNLAGKLL